MDVLREPEFNIDDYDHSYFLNEILALYEDADTQTKIELLKFLWEIRKDYKMEVISEKRQKEMLGHLTKAITAI